MNILGDDELPWAGSAECRTTDPEVFFPESGGRRVAELAKAICADCVVRMECLQEALSSKIPWGIWGGTTPEERLPRRRGGKP